MLRIITTITFTLTCILLQAQLVQVQGLYETDNVTSYNQADDPAIYVHPTNSDSSFFIGTDKSGSGRLELYNMDGSRYSWTTPGASMNNVDVLYGFPLGNDTVDLVGCSNRSANRLEMYKVDDNTRTLINITGSTSTGLVSLYGFIFHKDVCNDKYYAFITLKNSSGFVYQYELTDNGSGQINATLVRQILNLPTRTEGMCADKVLGHLYVAEESTGVWKYNADPATGNARTLMDTVGINGNLTLLVEGICIYYATDTTGYIIVSSQGASTYQVYDRAGNNAFLGEFEIIAGTVSDAFAADGIDVMSFPTSSTYPNGVFITHDNAGAGQYTNYMTVPWERIADSLNLDIVTTLDPRLIGSDYCNQGVGIDESENDLELQIFPNPFTGDVQLSWNDYTTVREITIYNAIGVEVFRQLISKNQVIQLSHLNAGMYFMRTENKTYKIVKSN
jgi:3-phytase